MPFATLVRICDGGEIRHGCYTLLLDPPCNVLGASKIESFAATMRVAIVAVGVAIPPRPEHVGTVWYARTVANVLLVNSWGYRDELTRSPSGGNVDPPTPGCGD
jgi:hypothetical protein